MKFRTVLLTYGLPALALAGAAVGIVAMTSNRPTSPVVEPARIPPTRPDPGAAAVIGATGLVEAEGRNVAIASPLSGVVSAVFVTPGQAVRAGAPLFAIDTRELVAQLAVRQAELAVARHGVEVSEANVAEALVNLEDRRAQYARATAVDDPRAVAQEEVALRRHAAEAARAQCDRAAAQLRQSRAAVVQAEALEAQSRTLLDRAVVRAPQTGTVLQVNVRPGEFASASESPASPVVLGATRTLHLRVDVDEADVTRVVLGQPATFSLRGEGGRTERARFIRVEPLLVGKTSLSGAAVERVDTRVLQLLYAFLPQSGQNVFVGQQVDVFLPARDEQRP